MRRGVALLLLALGAALVALLLFAMNGEGGGGRHRAGATEGPEATPGEAPGREEKATPGAASAPLDVADEDPNRIDGPDVTIRGVVLFEGVPVEACALRVHRAQATGTNVFWPQRTKEEEENSLPPIARAGSDAVGRFTLVVKRRSSLTVEARKGGFGVARVLVHVPVEGDPGEVKIELARAQVLRGRVVDPADAPVAGASVRIGMWLAQVPPIVELQTTNEAGEFSFDAISSGNLWMRVEAPGFPILQRQVSLPVSGLLLVQLRTGGSIAGLVRVTAGAPVAGATVVLATDTPEGFSGRGEATSDAEGRFRIESILPGPITSVIVLVPGWPPLVSGSGHASPVLALIKAGEEATCEIVIPGGVAVRGVVVRGEEGAPAPGAAIRLLRVQQNYLADFATGMADASGRFTLEGIPPGSYAIEAADGMWARKPRRNSWQQSPLTIDLDVVEGTEPPEQRIRLEATGIVEGRISEGSRLANHSGVGLQVGDLWESAQPDATGFFRFSNVAPGKNLVVQSWSPPAKSEPFDVEAGKVTNVTLGAGALPDFEGTVTDRQGRPVSGATVNAAPGDGQQGGVVQQIQNNSWMAVTTDAAGRYRLIVQEWLRQQGAALTWYVMASHRDYASALLRVDKLPAKGETARLDFLLEEGLMLTGRVEWEGGRAAVNAMIAVNPVVAPPPATQGAPEAPQHAGTMRSVVAGEDGTFTLTGLTPGSYTISAALTGGSSGSQPVEAGANGILLRLRETAFIGGVVITSEGRPVPGARVTALGPRGERRGNTQTSGDGRFRIQGLERGSYSLEASPGREAWQRPLFFETTRVDGVATGVDDARIEVKRGGKVSGRVVGPDGRPAAGITVVAMSLEGKAGGRGWDTPNPSGTTNGKGEFTVEGIGGKEVELIAAGAGFQPAMRRAAPGDSSVEMQLQACETVEGTLLGPDGAPAAGLWIWGNAVSPDAQQKLNDIMQRAGQTLQQSGVLNSGGQADGDGRFILRFPFPGEYYVNARNEAGVLRPVRVRTGARGVTLRLQRGLTLKGRIVDPEGRTIRPDAAAQLMFWINVMQDGQWVGNVQAQADGTFELTQVPSGPITIQAWASKNWKPGTVEAEAGASDVRVVLQPNDGK
ncbi:MAG: carboxypeptidase regulatory-like domain-containing protein [Planctomycetaceae bacterium]